MVTVQNLVLHLVDIRSLVQKAISRFVAGRFRYVTGRKNSKSGAKRGDRADSPGTSNQGQCYVQGGHFPTKFKWPNT